MRILVVEDDLENRIGLKLNLQAAGYEVDTAEDGEEGMKLAKGNAYDLFLLDIQLPGISGTEIIPILRQSDIHSPIIMLTGKTDVVDKVVAFELGADDYLTKPYNVRELLARIKAMLRRSTAGDQKEQEAGPVTIGRVSFSFAESRAWNEEQDELHLSHKQIEIVRYLHRNKNRTVSRKELLEQVWGYEKAPNTRTVDNFIVKIRQFIEEHPERPRILHTVHGVGYQMTL